jgi:hypothetical protein
MWPNDDKFGLCVQPGTGGGKAKTMFEFADDSMCLACNQNRLTFEPPSLYCTCCGQRIKRNQVRVTGVPGIQCDQPPITEKRETGR